MPATGDMPASLLTLPFELREQIFKRELKAIGTIELQYPIWADKSVFVHPLTQVCRSIRNEAVQIFYRNNVFVWVIDPEEDNRPDPTQYPLALRVSKDSGPTGPLMSTLPWYNVDVFEDLRHVRLNIYLPTSHDRKAWTETFPRRLARFVQTLDQGTRLKDIRILIGTWYTFLNFSTSQSVVFDVLEKMQIRGSVQVRTKNIYRETKTSIRRLDLENRMRAPNRLPVQLKEESAEDRPGGKHLDWEWEGGGLLG